MGPLIWVSVIITKAYYSFKTNKQNCPRDNSFLLLSSCLSTGTFCSPYFWGLDVLSIPFYSDATSPSSPVLSSDPDKTTPAILLQHTSICSLLPEGYSLWLHTVLPFPTWFPCAFQQISALLKEDSIAYSNIWWSLYPFLKL